MISHRKQINNLLEKEAKNIKLNVYFFTAYLPSKNYSKLQIKKRFKSLILKTLRNHQKLKNFSRLHQHLIKKVNQKVNSLKNLKSGFAVFVKFNALKQQKQRLEKILEKNITFLPLPKEPKKETYLGKTFDLDQLVSIQNSTPKALILNLKRQISTFYILKKNKLKKLTQLKNKFTKSKPAEYLEKYAPLFHQGTYYGTGADKKDKDKLKQTKKFLNQIKNFLKNNKTIPSRFNYLITFYSQSFANLIKSFKKGLQTILPSSHLILINKNINHKNKLQKQALKKITQFQKKEEKRLLYLAKENIDLFVKGWNKVTRADRSKKIATLFIKPTIEKKGYLLNKQFIYTYPVKNSRMVKNISPWLVKNVLDANGKLVLIKNNSIMPKIDIAAKLRF